MDIKARIVGNVVILDISGQVDANSANFVEIVGQCIRDGYQDILCNMEDVEFIDYLGISAIVLAYKELVNAKGRMKFASIPAHIKNSLSVAGLDKVVEIYATEEIALDSFKEDKVIEDIKKLQLRRRFKRLPIDIKIELRDKFTKSPECFKLDILNLSAIGAYIYGCDKFKLGDDVTLKMKLPPNQEQLEMEAKVVWLCDKQIQPQLYPGMGVEFRNMPSSAQDKLLGFIERNLSLLSSDD